MHAEIWYGNLREGLFGRTRRRCYINIEIYLQEMGRIKYIAWIVLAEDRDKWWVVGSTVMNTWVSNVWAIN